MIQKVFKLRLVSALFFLCVASLLGLFMRFAFVYEMPSFLDYRKIMHSHSHVALLGWLTASFYVLISRYFLLEKAVYSKIFWISQFLVALMAVSFFIQGYGFISIGLSVIYICVSILFCYHVWKDTKNVIHSTPHARLFLRAAIGFLFISSIGVLSMGPIIGMGLKGSALYYSAVQFYLHFQFNGWLIFGLFAVFFRILQNRKIQYSYKSANRMFWLLFTSCVLSYAQAVSWSTPENFIFWINSAGVVFQCFALYYFLKLLLEIKKSVLDHFSLVQYQLWGISFLALGFKMLMQTVVVIPYFAKVSYTIRNFVIGFIHLILLGVISFFVFGILKMEFSGMSDRGWKIFFAGFFITESLLFIQGILLWLGLGFIYGYYELITLFSVFLVVGAIRITLDFYNTSTTS